MDPKCVIAMTEGVVASISKQLDSDESDKVKIDRLVAAWDSYADVLKLVTKRASSKESDTLPTLHKNKKRSAPPAPTVEIEHDQTKREKTLDVPDETDD